MSILFMVIGISNHHHDHLCACAEEKPAHDKNRSVQPEHILSVHNTTVIIVITIIIIITQE